MMERLYIGFVVAATIILCAYFYGYSTGKHDAKIEQLHASVNAHIKREGIHNEVSAMDRYAVCIDIGGLPDDCNELRRLEESTKSE